MSLAVHSARILHESSSAQAVLSANLAGAGRGAGDGAARGQVGWAQPAGSGARSGQRSHPGVAVASVAGEEGTWQGRSPPRGQQPIAGGRQPLPPRFS